MFGILDVSVLAIGVLGIIILKKVKNSLNLLKPYHMYFIISGFLMTVISIVAFLGKYVLHSFNIIDSQPKDVDWFLLIFILALTINSYGMKILFNKNLSNFKKVFKGKNVNPDFLLKLFIFGDLIWIVIEILKLL